MQRDDAQACRRILIVEDEAIIAMDLERRLARMGYEVVDVADTGVTALAMVAEHQPDLVLMDIIIQGNLDGIETSERLARLSDVPVIFLTAHTDEATLQRAKRTSPYGYLVKPITERELRTMIEMAFERHRAEREARILKHVFDDASSAALVVDASAAGQPVLLCNAAFHAMTGYDAAEARGRNPDFLCGPDTDPASREQWRAALAQGRECHLQLRLHRRDGSSLWCELAQSPARTPAGRATHFVCFLRDLSEQRRAAESLLQAEKLGAVGRLAGGIAHDFNNLLSTILTFGAFVRDALPPGSPCRPDIDEVLRAAETGAGLTRQLLAFSRKQPLAPRPLDVNAKVSELERLLKRTIGENIELAIRTGPRPAVVRIDPAQFDQVLMNLAINARDAMPDGGRLLIGVEHADGGAVALTVTDTGAGMDAETMARIFDPFFTTKREGSGTGLGLATSQTIARDAGGEIHVRSAPGGGSEFRLELPACEEPPAIEALPAPTPSAGTGKLVLVVEDDPPLRKAARRILESAGYGVTEARDAIQAAATLERLGAQIDLVITDIVLPGESGLAVAAKARALAPRAPVIFTSGHIDNEIARGVDVERLLWKPYSTPSLLQAAQRALAAGADADADADGTAGRDVPGTARRTVLVVDDDSLMRTAIGRLLEGDGFRTIGVPSVLAARIAIRESGHALAAILCDLTLEDGSGAELIGWMHEKHPQLVARTLVLTGGAIDEAGRALEASGQVEVILKPFDPGHLLQRLRAIARGDSREDST